MHILEAILVLLAVSLALTLLSRRLQVPPAVMLVLGGMVLAFMPGVFHLTLRPDLALALFLPPLLQTSAFRTDWAMFRSNIVFIVLMAFGAVLFTTGAVAWFAHEMIPGLSWPAAITLGAIVSPPDAVAATAILARFKLPKRIITVLEGESLINDASALIIYRFAVGAVIMSFQDIGKLAQSFAYIAGVGVIVGLATGFAANWLVARLRDKHLEIVVTFLAAFGSYLLAEHAGGSGVLAAVACGGIIGRAQFELAAQTRLEGATAWQLVEFILSSLVFLLVGLQLHGIMIRLESYDPWHLAALAGGLSAVLIVSRFVWVFATFYPAQAVTAVINGGKFSPPLSYPTIIAWTGMRGVVSLAAALALPESFEARDLIVFLAFCAIFVTLVVQGTTLKALIRRVDPQDDEIAETGPAVAEARAVVTAAIAGVGPEASSDHKNLLAELRAARVDLEDPATTGDSEKFKALLEQRLQVLHGAREKLKDRIDDVDGETLSTLIRELDLEEEQVRLALGSEDAPPM